MGKNFELSRGESHEALMPGQIFISRCLRYVKPEQTFVLLGQAEDNPDCAVVLQTGIRSGDTECVSIRTRGFGVQPGVNSRTEDTEVTTSTTELSPERARSLKDMFDRISERQIEHGIKPKRSLSLQQLALMAFIDCALQEKKPQLHDLVEPSSINNVGESAADQDIGSNFRSTTTSTI